MRIYVIVYIYGIRECSLLYIIVSRVVCLFIIAVHIRDLWFELMINMPKEHLLLVYSLNGNNRASIWLAFI